MEAVYDRTLEDVLTRNAKGTLNANDMNRITSNLSQAAKELGDSYTATIYYNNSKPTGNDYALILDKVSKLRMKYLVYPDTPDLPEMPLNQFEKFNSLEKNILDLHRIWESNKERKIYCGEIHVGQRGLL